jgi:hypothetical protein
MFEIIFGIESYCLIILKDDPEYLYDVFSFICTHMEYIKFNIIWNIIIKKVCLKILYKTWSINIVIVGIECPKFVFTKLVEVKKA